MTRPAWLETTLSNKPDDTTQRHNVAIHDVLHAKASSIGVGEIKNDGTLVFDLPLSMRSVGQPHQTAYQSNNLMMREEVHGTHALMVWTDQRFYDPAKAQASHDHPRTDKKEYTRRGITDITDYAGVAIHGDARSMTHALQEKFGIPLYYEWIKPTGNMPAHSITSGLVLMTTPEHEETLMTRVMQELRLQAARTAPHPNAAAQR